jgi:hypothetical protein
MPGFKLVHTNPSLAVMLSDVPAGCAFPFAFQINLPIHSSFLPITHAALTQPTTFRHILTNMTNSYKITLQKSLN